MLPRGCRVGCSCRTRPHGLVRAPGADASARSRGLRRSPPRLGANLCRGDRGTHDRQPRAGGARTRSASGSPTAPSGFAALFDVDADQILDRVLVNRKQRSAPSSTGRMSQPECRGIVRSVGKATARPEAPGKRRGESGGGLARALADARRQDRHAEHRHIHTRDTRYTSCNTVPTEMGGALNSQNCSSRRSCRGQRRNPGFDEADSCALAAQSDAFVNEPAGGAAATKDQGGRGDCLFRLPPSGGLRRVASGP